MKLLNIFLTTISLCVAANAAAVSTPERSLKLFRRFLSPSDCSGIQQREDNDQPGTSDGSYCTDDDLPDCQILVCKDGADACFGKGSCTKGNSACGPTFPADVYDDQGRLCSSVCSSCSSTLTSSYLGGGKNQGGGPPPEGDGGEA